MAGKLKSRCIDSPIVWGEAVRIAAEHCTQLGARHGIEVALAYKRDDPVTLIPPRLRVLRQKPSD